jgi:hypothetical protein
MEFSPAGGRVTEQKEIPWEGDTREGIYWPREWLIEELRQVKASARKGDVIALAMPGADLYVSSREADTPPRIQHYRGVMDGGFIEKATSKVWPTDLYRRTNGANVAAFQPYAQLLAYEERQPGSVRNAPEIVPLNDWMTDRLTGRKGHDPVMLQDQGLTFEGRAVCEEIAGVDGLAGRIAPWPAFAEDEILETGGGVYVVPVTHDSVPARTAGYSAAPWVIWTGTWIGTACSVGEVRASALAYESGVAFEGAGPSLSAITNVGMLGRIYKVLIQRAGIDFTEASLRVQRLLDERELETVDVTALPADEDQAVQKLSDRIGWDPDLLLSTYIASTADACRHHIRATSEILGMEPPVDVAVIGGWARNTAFLCALEQHFGEVRVPEQAPYATAVGLAADALVRVRDASSMKEALEMLPEFSE